MITTFQVAVIGCDVLAVATCVPSKLLAAAFLPRYMECVLSMPPETPLAFGLHPNTEIGYRTQQCEDLFKTLMESEGTGSGSSAGKGGTEIEGEAVSVPAS